MNIEEQREFYDTLDKCDVVHQHIKSNIVGFLSCIIDTYTFGDYEIEFTDFKSLSDFPDMREVFIRKKGSNDSKELLDRWNKHYPDKKYVYDMFIAAKNRAEGKNYTNPFRLQFFKSATIKSVPKRRVLPNLFGLLGQRVASIAK